MRRDERVHGIAWWLWAAGLAVAALRCTNPILLLGLGSVAALVATARRSSAPWGRSLGAFVRLGLIVIVLRVLLQLVFGQRLPGHVLFTIPAVALPHWAEGVSIGGPVTVEGILTALVGGLRLAVVLVCFGAANSVASPREVLRSLPAVLHEVAVAITVALCFAPEVMASVIRVREARTLRGRPTRGFAGLRGIAVPVLEDALDRSTQLAASMGSRGFGRAGLAPSMLRSRLSLAAVVIGIVAVLGGGYGIAVSGAPVPAAPLFAGLGIILIAAGVAGNGRRAPRTRYRPAPFGWRSSITVLAGWLPLCAFSILVSTDPSSISWSAYPLSWPVVAPLALLSIAGAAIPLAVSPADDAETVRSKRAVVTT